MTRTEVEALQELNTSPEALRERTAKMDALARDNKQPQSFSEALQFAQGNPDNAAQTKPRRTPVKGKCVNCGNNWSRHPRKDEETRRAWCTNNLGSPMFSLEEAQPEPQGAAGALSKEDAGEIMILVMARDDKRANLEAAQDAYDAAHEALTIKLKSLTK